MSPAELEQLSGLLLKQVPECDATIVSFFDEAIKCYRAGNYVSAEWMLGVASEQALLLVIAAYGSSINDELNRKRFLGRVNDRMFAVKYAKFKQSFKSADPHPTEFPLADKLEHLLDNVFGLYGRSRDELGYPCAEEERDPSIMLKNAGKFPLYMERIYGLIDFFNTNEMVF